MTGHEINSQVNHDIQERGEYEYSGQTCSPRLLVRIELWKE